MSLFDKLDTSILSRPIGDKLDTDILSRPIGGDLNTEKIPEPQSIPKEEMQEIPQPEEKETAEKPVEEEKIENPTGKQEEKTQEKENVTENKEAHNEERKEANAPVNEHEGVIINGVKWATCNVDAPGTFTACPDDPGKFYQWNSKKAWVVGSRFSDLDKSATPGDNMWKEANDPSPAGWRLPTVEDFNSLLDHRKVTAQWGKTKRGVFGKMFTDKATGNRLFLPAAGYLSGNGELKHARAYSDYWSCMSATHGQGAYNLHGDKERRGIYGTDRMEGRSIRCVAVAPK